MLILSIIGIGGSLALWSTSKPTQTSSYQVQLTVYSGGTPVRGVAEISDILAAGATADGALLTSKAGANPVLWTAPDRAVAGSVEANAAQVASRLVDEVKVRASDLETLLQTNENALQPYLSAKSYLEGVDTGLIVPVVATVTESTVVNRSGIVWAFLPLLISGVVFFVIAGTISFIASWRKHRAQKSAMAGTK